MPEERNIPSEQSPDVASFTILSGGTELPGTLEVISFSISKELNRIPKAKIVVSDGSASAEDFTVSNESWFQPGEQIELKAGYHGDEDTLFKGIVVKHSIQIRQSKSRLVLECHDETFKMTINRKSRYFFESTDSDALDTIIGDYGLKKDVEATEVTHTELVQFDTTDWGFLVARAEANQKVVRVDDGRVEVKSVLFEDPVLTLQYGATILEMDAEIDARFQHDGVKTLTWDPANQEPVEVEANEPSFEEAGNLSTSDLTSGLGLEAFQIIHGGNLKEDEIQQWADSKLLKARLAKIRGRVLFQGFPDVKPGSIVELSGVGDRFNGKVYVSGIRHDFLEGNWTTHTQIGLDPEWFANHYELTHQMASSMLPAVHGLQIGIVTNLEDDPDGEDRIQVRLPIIDPGEDGVWARLGCLDAGDNRGCFFRPEIEDEVIVGFFNGDPRDPVILGMLHSSAKPTPEPISNDNHLKGFISRSELKLVFDDENTTLTLETPGGNKITLDEDQGGIYLEDQNGNKIEMSSDGITIESAKDLQLKASGDIKLEGMNIENTANAQFKADGSAGAEVSSSAVMTIKGSLVQIN
ncbi:MAG: type VI secretion system tip protein VgrG [Bacteroidota bacterium]